MDLAIIEDRLSFLCDESCQAKNGQEGHISCQLTSVALQERREKVLTILRKKVVLTKELPNGYAFQFTGDDQMLNELTDFIQSERACCRFFTFGLSIAGDKQEIWLTLTGPKGSKELIQQELSLIK